MFVLQKYSAGVAQLVEQLICNQPVGGSIPFASSKKARRNAGLFYFKNFIYLFYYCNHLDRL